MRRANALVTAMISLVLLASAACDGGGPGEDGTGSETTPQVTEEAEDTSPTPEASTTPAAPLSDDELTGKVFDPGAFDEDSAVIDNQWFPLQPGMRYVYEGKALDDGERIERRVVMTVVDMTKVIAGIRTLVVHDLDYNDGELVESDLLFFAQDVVGNIWQLGEYPEEHEEGEIVKAPAWFHGAAQARAGLSMKASPRLGTPSYAAGWGPAVGWNDRAKVREMGAETCVPVDCYTDVLVIREYNRDKPGASQLKYYAPGVGNVRVGWMGANEEERERMTLVELAELTPDLLAEARAEVIEQDQRGYRIRKKVYGTTSPVERIEG